MKIPWSGNRHGGLNKQSTSIAKGDQRQKVNRENVLKPVALIKTGETIAQIVPQHGDFEDWFAEGMGLSGLLQIDVFRQQPLPEAEKLAAIVITGSPAMVSTKLDWSERTGEWLVQAVQKGIPVLGVCYGHQLLAHALGGRVGPNPAGRQIGTVQAQLDDSAEGDSLLGHLPLEFPAQTSHSEAVLELPTGAVRLATSPLDPNFAIRFAENTWGLQFHPEFSASVTSEYIRLRTDTLRTEGLDPEQLLSKVKNTFEAKSVLKKFTDLL
jgi:GMP synthase (glutamine-hydrolysing)